MNLEEIPDWVINTEKHKGFNGNLNNYNNWYRTQDATKWEPTTGEIRECCGVWVYKHDETDVITVRSYGNLSDDQNIVLSEYNDLNHFRDEFALAHFKIEPIPEQCIPKPEPERERYEWACIVEEWM